MLSNAQSKYIRSLSQQKYRKQYNVFIAEGDKIAREWLMSDAQIHTIAAVSDWVLQYAELIQRHPEAEQVTVSQDELKKISTQQTPNQVLLVVQKPEIVNTDDKGWTIALQQVQDPGNLGTIIRIADWFGVKNVVCSPDCTDFYNPKVVQAAMGGHLRVQLHVATLADYLKHTGRNIYAATLDGDDVYTINRQQDGILLIGNESKGLTDDIAGLAAKKVTIPRKGGAESLNAGVSAGILIALLKGS